MSYTISASPHSSRPAAGPTGLPTAAFGGLPLEILPAYTQTAPKGHTAYCPHPIIAVSHLHAPTLAPTLRLTVS